MATSAKIRGSCLVLVAVAVTALALSCDKGPISVDKPPPGERMWSYQDLTEQWHVLNNLQLAMNEMDADRYVELLDPDSFVFRFDPNDVKPGDSPEWGFAEDSTSATHMLGGEGSNPVLSIDLELVNFKNAQWTEFDSTGSPGLYRTTVQYNFVVRTQNEIYYLTSGAPAAEFTIAARDVGGKMVWRIVEWKDLGNGTATASPASTQETNWSKLKALYR